MNEACLHYPIDSAMLLDILECLMFIARVSGPPSLANILLDDADQSFNILMLRELVILELFLTIADAIHDIGDRAFTLHARFSLSLSTAICHAPQVCPCRVLCANLAVTCKAAPHLLQCELLISVVGFGIMSFQLSIRVPITSQ